MKRREFLDKGARYAAGAFAGAALLDGVLYAAGSGKKPNIVIILTDDLGYGDIGCFGSKSIATPNLDRMASEGARLTNFFSSAAVCSPSRAGLLTGRYPPRTGVTEVLFPFSSLLTTYNRADGVAPGLPLDEMTIAEALKPAGYSTCCVGKWHLGDEPPFWPNKRGFDHYMGLLYSNDMTPLRRYRNGKVIEDPVNQNLLTREYTQEAIEFISHVKDRPFFLYFAHTFPHVPLHASPEFRGRSKGGLYGDCVEEIDWSAGQLALALKHFGMDDNTVIFFTSDNGPWFEGSPGGYRGRKNESFDGGMRVPFIARWPGRIPPGKSSDEMSMNFDLFATSLAIAGAPIPTDRVIDGKNILPMLQGREPSPHEALYFYHGRELQAVRWKNWKYHRRHRVMVYPFVKHGPWLFNLEDDPNESYNAIDKYPDIAKKLEGMMKEWEANFKAR